MRALYGGVALIVLKILLLLLKIIGWLLLIVLLLLIAAMCVPVRLYVGYEPDLKVRVRYLFLRFYIAGEKPPKKPPGRIRRSLAAAGNFLLIILHYIFSAFSAVFRGIKKGFRRLKFIIRRKPKKKIKAVKKQPEEKKQSFFGALREQRGFFGALKFFADSGKMLGGAVARIYRGIKINRLVLHADISGEDAADTAIKYGRICAGAFPALSFLVGHTRSYDPSSSKTNDIEITPDFGGEGIKIYFIGEFTLFPILMIGNLLRGVIKFAVAQIRYTSKLKKEKS